MSQVILQSNPGAGYFAHKAEIDAAVLRALESRWYILGKEVEAFEQEFAAYLGSSHAIGVASGTDAVQLALRACGVGPGDLVFTVSHTATATVTAIVQAGAAPVYVDIDPVTYTMDPARLDAAIRSVGAVGRPRAVLPVHLYGHPADMTGILEVADRHGLVVVEDCAQSHGARWDGRQTGTVGQIAAFSFYPTKNLGALGDGGAVVTNDSDLARQVRLLREYGWKERYVSSVPGMNSRLDELQAAILRVKLKYLDHDNAARRAIAGRYTEKLSGAGVTLPSARFEAFHVYHQYVLQVEDRDAVKDNLRARSVGTLIHYPVPVHRQPAYADYHSGGLEHTERAAGRILSLPMYPELSLDEADGVADDFISVTRAFNT